MENIDKQYAPQIKAYTDKIEMLVNVISKLEEDERQLDKKVASHQANTIDYEKNQTLLNEILKDIAIKTSLQADATNELNKINAELFEFQKQNDVLSLSVEEKKKYISDIDVLKNQIVILQKEMEQFQNEHSDNKNKAVNEINEIKLQVKKIHENIGLLL